MTEVRNRCLRCRRPEVTCLCSHVEPIETRTRVVILQHPRERDMAIGTARLASLCLTNSELHVGLEFEGTRVLERALGDVSRPAYLLYPGENAVDVMKQPPEGPITLVVVDGTWPNSRKLVRLNPTLAKLPRLSFTPPRPSEYRIRREPRDECVSTAEAIAHLLGALEGPPERYEALLRPFRTMIDRQIEHIERHHTPYRRLRQRPGARPDELSRLPEALRVSTSRWVCLTVEANAWPSQGDSDNPDELIYLIAEALPDGRRLEMAIRPRAELNPVTPSRTGLSRELIEAGASIEEFRERFLEFLGPDDLVLGWTDFPLGLLRREGIPLDGRYFRLRAVSGDRLRRHVGGMEELLKELGRSWGPVLSPGRAGQKHAQLMGLVEELRELVLSGSDDALKNLTTAS